jgi:pimeloyl-ACP methyl ester carboxylesterase
VRKVIIAAVCSPSTRCVVNLGDMAMFERFARIGDEVLRAQLRLGGFRSRFVDTSAGRMHAMVSEGGGDLPPFVLLHGFAAASHYYGGLASRMRPLVRHVIAPDLPGHGVSAGDARTIDWSTLEDGLCETLDTLIDRPAIVFGNSLGGAAAVRYAAMRPNKVRGLFLVAPGGAPMDDATFRSFLSRFALEDHDAALDFVDRLFERPPPYYRHLIAWGTRHQFARPAMRALMQRGLAINLLTPEELRSLSMPTHVVWGGADRILLPSHLAFFREHLPAHATLEVVPRFGHTPHMDQPDALHTMLVAFARETAPRRSSVGSIPAPSGAPAT